MKNSLTILLFCAAALLLGAGCSESDQATKAPTDVENAYVPYPGKQISTFVAKFPKYTRTHQFTYDDLGRIKHIDYEDASEEKATKTSHNFVYREDRIEVDKTQAYFLDETGRTDRVETTYNNTLVMTLEYNDDGYLNHVSNDKFEWTYDLFWSNNNLTSSSGAISNSRTYTNYPNKTNLELSALLTNAYWIFEHGINGCNPPMGTFGFFGKRCENLPASDFYNVTTENFSYEFDEDQCPVRITTGSGVTYEITYVK